jgi:putative SOS response-associated peptidase YedK
VWTLHQPADVARDRRPVPADRSGKIDTVIEREGKRDLVPMRWGLVPSWWKKTLKETPSTFNARAETVAEKPMFRAAFKRNRCLIPASGYYEWQSTPTGKQPYYYTARDRSPLTIAGLWDEWKDIETGEHLKSCTMIVTNANKLASQIHDRMPVLLQPKDFDHWLAGRDGTELLKTAPNDYLQVWPVSRRVNSSRTAGDDPALIDRVAA